MTSTASPQAAYRVPDVAPTEAEHVGQSDARAYCGPAHGRSWAIDADRPPPWTVDLFAADEQVIYRLVYCLHSRQPARDHLGNFVYVPMQHDLDLQP